MPRSGSLNPLEDSINGRKKQMEKQKCWPVFSDPQAKVKE